MSGAWAVDEFDEDGRLISTTIDGVTLDPDVFWTKREPERDYSGERGQ